MARTPAAAALSGALLLSALLLLLRPNHRQFDLVTHSAAHTGTDAGAEGGWNHTASAEERVADFQKSMTDQKVNWQLAYKTSSAVAMGSTQGWDADTIRAAWSSCNVHYAAVKYEISGKVHSIYRRMKGPDKHGVDAWKKGAPDCGQCDGFDPVELITDCWVSKWKSGASNAIGTDFQMFSNEKDYFDRSAGLTPWKSCNFDDCTIKVGYPRDCGPTAPQTYDWHAFEGGDSRGKTDVAFYISVCNGWSAPVITFGDPGGAGWGTVYILVLLGLGYFVGGSTLGARRKGQPLKKSPEMLRQHPHYGNWSQLHGLVQDGVGFSRAVAHAKLLGRGGGGYQPVPLSKTGSGDGQAKRSGNGNTKSKSKKSTREVSKRSKDGKQPKRVSRDKSSKREGGSTDQQTMEVTEETTEEERERLLREERTAGVHSSQQAIKVVGLNA